MYGLMEEGVGFCSRMSYEPSACIADRGNKTEAMLLPDRVDAIIPTSAAHPPYPWDFFAYCVTSYAVPHPVLPLPLLVQTLGSPPIGVVP